MWWELHKAQKFFQAMIFRVNDLFSKVELSQIPKLLTDTKIMAAQVM